MSNILSHTNWRLHRVEGCTQAARWLHQNHTGVVVCARELADGDWRRLWERIRTDAACPAFVVGARLADEELWGEVLNLGCYDLLEIPFEPEEALRVIAAGLRSWRWEQERLRNKPRAAAAAALGASIA